MNLVLLLFAHTFPVPSDKTLWHVFSWFICVVILCISIPSYNVLDVVSVSDMLYSTVDCIFFIVLTVGSCSVCLFVLTFVVWTI